MSGSELFRTLRMMALIVAGVAVLAVLYAGFAVWIAVHVPVLLPGPL